MCSTEIMRGFRKSSYEIQLVLALVYFWTAIQQSTTCPDTSPTSQSYTEASGTEWCFWLITTPQSPAYQLVMCRNHGGNLAQMESKAQSTSVMTALLGSWANVSMDVYIGVRDLAQTGVFQTWDGTALNHSRWANGEPSSPGKYCVMMNRTDGYLWYNIHCNEHLQALCYCVLDPLDDSAPNTCASMVSGSGDTTVSLGDTTTSTTSTVTVPEQTTSDVCYPSDLLSCMSCCFSHKGPDNTTLQTKFNEMINDLRIDAKSTNRYQRKFVSAADSRPLSVGIGAIAIVVLTLVATVIVVWDIPVMYSQLALSMQAFKHALRNPH